MIEKKITIKTLRKEIYNLKQKSETKDFDFFIGRYTKIGDITLIRLFNYIFYKKVGNIYEVLGIVFNRDLK